MKIKNLSLATQQLILRKVGERFIMISECNHKELVQEELKELVERYLDPLSDDDFFGTEGWARYFDVD